jgi:integrase
MPSLSKKITLKALEGLKNGEILWDTELRGFGARGRGTGLYYVLKTRVGGQQRWFTIGKHGAPWTPDSARKKVLGLLGEIADGNDPSEVREDLKRRISISDLCEIYLKEGCGEKKDTTLATDKGRIERHIKPLLGKKDARVLKKRDIEQFMRDIADGKTATDVKTKKRGRAIVEGGKGTSSRTVGLLGGIFSFAVDRGILIDNPARGIRRFKDKRVERFLSEDELSRLGSAIASLEAEEAITAFAAAAMRLLLFTGARRGEILAMRWDWVDFERGFIFLPNSKTGKKPVYLSAPALEILAKLPRIEGNPFVICGEAEKKPMADLKRPWARVCKRADISSLRIHDLRHNFASTGAMGGLSLPMIGKLLGHLRTETTARYSHLADDPIRLANERIGQKIAATLNSFSPAAADPVVVPKAKATR